MRTASSHGTDRERVHLPRQVQHNWPTLTPQKGVVVRAWAELEKTSDTFYEALTLRQE